MRSNGGNAGLLLSLSKPHLELEDILCLLTSTGLDIEGKMSEGSLKSSSGSLNGDFSGLEANSD